jgi:hypothetical protein
MLLQRANNSVERDRPQTALRGSLRGLAATAAPHVKSIFLFLVLIILCGCSYRGAYEGIQARNRNECSKLPPSQYDECMRKANKSYDDYERERKEVMGE